VLVSVEICFSDAAYLFLVKVPAHHSAPSLAALAEGFRADYIQTCSAHVVCTSVRTCNIDELVMADVEARQRLRSSSSSSLTVSRTRHPTVGDRAFSVTVVHVWNSLPDHFRTFRIAVFRSRFFSRVIVQCLPFDSRCLDTIKWRRSWLVGLWTAVCQRRRH